MNKRRLSRLWQKPAAEKRLDSEMQFHLEQQIADYVASGMRPDEARCRANAEFGGVELYKEECRDTRWENQLDILTRDLRFALRNLLKDRRFSVIAIFTLALAIGASTAIFSVVDNAIFEPFAYKDASRLITLRVRNLDRNEWWKGLWLYDEFREIKEQNHVFDDTVANLQDDVIYAAPDTGMLLAGNYVTPRTFEFYGLPAYLGRNLEPADYQPDAPPVFVMRYKAWVNKFGGDPSYAGKSFVLNGVSRTLVGIAAPRFAWGGAELWMPRGPEESKPITSQESFANGQYWGVVAHLRPGVSLQTAEADLNVIGQRLATLHPKEYPKRFKIEVLPFGAAVLPEYFRKALYIFSAAVGLLLLIGCSNVANLLLVRATTREKEFAVRSALGATRFRLIRELLMESLLLAVCGAAFGALIAWGGVRTISAVLPDFTIASETVIEMNLAVLVFALVTGVATVFIFGLVPALQASRCDLIESLRDAGKGLGGTGGRATMRNAVIILEVALSLTLLFSAGLFVRSFVALQHVPLGMQTDHVLTARIPLSPDRYKTGTQFSAFFRPLLERLKALPGVSYAAATGSPPLYGGFHTRIEIAGKPQLQDPRAQIQLSSADYFSILRIPILEGRGFTDDEADTARPVMVVNEAFKHRYFGDGSPIGERVQILVLKEVPDPVKDPWFDIVGVAGDARNNGLEWPVEPEVWIPYSVTGSSMRSLLVRTTGEPQPMLKSVARVIWAADQTTALAEANTLDYYLELFTFAQPRFGLWIVSIFAAIGLVLVTIGVYSVVSYSTSRRTHEIGIRMALGAATRNVLNMILRKGLGLLLIGIAIGLAVSLALSRLIVTQLWGVSAHDTVTILAVVGLLLLVGLIACWIPAHRATRVNPVTALRCE